MIPTQQIPANDWHIGFGAGPYTELTTTPAIIVVDGTVANDASATPFPDVTGCILSWLHGEIDTIAGGVTSIIWSLRADSQGDYAMSYAVTSTIVVGSTVVTRGGIAETLGVQYIRPIITNSSAGKLYVVAATNAGTCRLKPRLYYRAGL